MKNVLVLREAAAQAILAQADYYSTKVGPTLADRWEKAVTTGVLRAVELPESGTKCRFKSKELAGLRWLPVPGFPRILIFYFVRRSEVEVVHVLHSARDIEEIL